MSLRTFFRLSRFYGEQHPPQTPPLKMEGLKIVLKYEFKLATQSAPFPCKGKAGDRVLQNTTLMALKKSDLYSAIWDSCDQLRGGMDASQYKDYVLTLLFVKYVSDKYAGKEDAVFLVPEGASFEDMVKLKNQPDIGDRINKEILAPLAEENGLAGALDSTDFNDSEKLGEGKEKIDKLTNLISIFQNPALNFADNEAGGDDLLGDAYEYLMQKFATQSGKSKGQFYTPAEVSRIISMILGVEDVESSSTTVYDPACGSGSLLLKVADQAPVDISIFGQEIDIDTVAMAKMNMVLHNYPAAVGSIVKGNSLADPKFAEANGELKRFDYVVANPPFSYKSWTNGLDPENDEYGRFDGFGIPPKSNGDYAFLLHIVKSLKNTGTAAVVLPHGVLFRGNAEARIRKELIRRGYIKGIIGLPANLFYGTGIPACIIVIDKENAAQRSGIFMIDASEGYRKDGNKNRLRDRDIHKIVDYFNTQHEEEGYARLVPTEEIVENDYNLNIPRYIDSTEEEDIQDLGGHLKGGIPERDIEALKKYWEVYPTMRELLFKPLRPGYRTIDVAVEEMNEIIHGHREFEEYRSRMEALFRQWRDKHYAQFRSIDSTTRPSEFIESLSESLLDIYRGQGLIDNYAIYQTCMDYWSQTMKDDVFMLIEEGWRARLEPIHTRSGKIRSYRCELIPEEFIINRYFVECREEINQLTQMQEEAESRLQELVQEQSGEDGLLANVTSDAGNVTKSLLKSRMKEVKGYDAFADEYAVLSDYAAAATAAANAKKKRSKAEKALSKQVIEKYEELDADEVKTLVVDDKWLPDIKAGIDGEIDNISRQLTERLQELADRYRDSLPEIEAEVGALEQKVETHLIKMGVL